MFESILFHLAKSPSNTLALAPFRFKGLSTWEEMLLCNKKLATQLALTIEMIKEEIEFKYILRYGDIKPEHYYQIRDSLIHTYLVSSVSVNASKLLLLFNDNAR